jgi:hypothetical protein
MSAIKLGIDELVGFGEDTTSKANDPYQTGQFNSGAKSRVKREIVEGGLRRQRRRTEDVRKQYFGKSNDQLGGGGERYKRNITVIEGNSLAELLADVPKEDFLNPFEIEKGGATLYGVPRP